jgi:predicted metalloprotease with PDZ domain
VAPHPPSDEFARAGYRLTFTDEPNKVDEIAEEVGHDVDLRYSLGVILKSENDDADPGEVSDVLTDSPAAKAGLGAGVKVIAVNWRTYSADGLRAAVKAAATTREPIALLVQSGKTFRLISIDYHGGARYPHLERTAGTSDMLEAITAPR